MPCSSLTARPPRGAGAGAPAVSRDPDVLASFLEDAAHFPGGHAVGVAAPSTELGIAAALREAGAVLPIGAQSSLTGGATPMGELVLSTARLNRILEIGPDSARMGIDFSPMRAKVRR